MRMYALVELCDEFAGDIYAANDFDTMIKRFEERRRDFERDLIGLDPESKPYKVKCKSIEREKDFKKELEGYRNQRYGFFDLDGGNASWLLLILDSERLDSGGDGGYNVVTLL